MARSIYITSAEGRSGKSTVALGVLDTLGSTISRVGVFRPIARSITERDYVLELLLGHVGVDLDYDECVGVTYDDVHADPDAALSRIVERYKAVERKCDVVVIVGSDYTDVGSPTELGYNARIAANLSAPVLLVLTGRRPDESGGRTADEMRQITELSLPELVAAHATTLAIVSNRSDADTLEEIEAAIEAVLPDALEPAGHDVPVWAIPEDPLLIAPTVGELLTAVEGSLLKGDEALLSRESLGVVISAMSMENVLARLTEGAVVVVPGDRSEVLLAVLMAHASDTFPSLAGIVLNGGFDLSPTIERLMSGLDQTLPLILTELGTYATAQRITQTRGRLSANSRRKIDTALDLFEKHVKKDALMGILDVRPSSVVTPLMFEYQLIEQARTDRRHIVLPEGDDDRILRAAGTILRRGIADLTILGEEVEVRSRAIGLGIDLGEARILSPFDDVLRERFAEEYTRVRSHKGMVLDIARETVTDVSYFGTMMVHLGLADGMVSGAAHTTAHTIRPGFEIIKTRSGVSVVSSVFLMALQDRVLVYGDCAVNPDPTAEQLADIAVSSSETATQFGIDPRVAMLSYSTGESGAGADVEKVRTATHLVRDLRPDLPVEGPIQYDAAADAAVAAAKMPDSQVAGRATVFIFPDLNTGNNTYKAVQRSAGAVAIGPVLQGLNKPINDLSRGALVEDIVNTVAITAIQAQAIAATAEASAANARAAGPAAAAGGAS
ncbi:phosphate acetyltransferase [Planctomonas psychrotolerans]|uniref:phosphate acetyltransferase n=1 Tax=Planctomonas psychrotolerans TaxID=2528712 RepID=UPI00123AF453|nr:phosphate acetyltransferase [Planctomonas psychrotolerans]